MSMLSKLKNNPWILSTFTLAVLVLVLVFSGFVSLNQKMSVDKAGESFVNFINERSGAGIEYVSGKDFGSNLYEITVLADGKEVPVQITKDGKYFIQVLADLEETVEEQVVEETTTQVTKTDKPISKLFIWSYCPYGVTAQKPFAEVASLLGNYADFEIVLYYAGHGEYEAQQNKIQACIQKLDKDKYWAYSAGFVDTIYPKCGSSRDTACDESESVKLMDSLGIDSDKILSCVESDGEELVAEHYEQAKELGVTGSPTLVVNGAMLSNVGRNSEAYKSAICSAFNEAPSVCGETLSTTGSTASGNC